MWLRYSLCLALFLVSLASNVQGDGFHGPCKQPDQAFVEKCWFDGTARECEEG